MDSTVKFITEYCKAYPRAEIRDIFKLIFQSALGCEHLVSEPSAAAERIRAEAETSSDAAPETEYLDGGFCRCHLKPGRPSPDTLAKILALSAVPVDGGIDALRQKLADFIRAADEGCVPFPAKDVRAAADAWSSAGFPAVHHSELFRETYHPSYRVIKAEYGRLIGVFSAIDNIMSTKHGITLAIDGGSASGKTTAAELIRRVYGGNVFHADDYFLQPRQRTPERYKTPGGNIDRERLEAEILSKLGSGTDIVYCPFDCSAMALGNRVTVESSPVNIIEGAYTMHPDFRKYYDFSVFLRIDADKQSQRIKKRNGAYAESFFNRWIPLEKAYFDAFDVESACDIVIDA